MAEPTANPYSFAPYDPSAAAAIAGELGLPAAVATLLARRGFGTPWEVETFLEGADRHDPAEFPDIGAAVAAVRRTIEAGGRITVHGDYDADGVCATAILVEALRSLDADCDWLIPSRLDDGYGLDDELPTRLAARGTRLLISVDCGIGSADVIEGLRAAGIDAIVTDHHQPPEDLPDCPVLHPAIGYPFPGLCGAAVAAKLAEALCGEPRGLDLAAIATVADSVPLIGENRRIVREGLRIAAVRPRPGLRTLMAIARVAPERLSARDVAFKLAPRINAAGRLYRADAAVELLLTNSVERATEMAQELDRINSERRVIESEVVGEAQRQATELLADGEQPALVLAGRGWHPGVVGIAASRLVDRHRVPVLMIAIDEQGTGVGSGRSIPGIDLLAALGQCAPLLNRFGGHKAAAGLELDADRVPLLRERFAAAVRAQPAVGTGRDERLDGVLGVGELTLELARALEELGPFGQGNPEPRFLLTGVVAEDVTPIGEEGRHARLMLSAGAKRAAAVAFGVGAKSLEWNGAKLDLTVGVEVNEWNGAVSARTVIESVVPALATLGQPCCGAVSERARAYLALVAAHLSAIDAPAAVPAGSAQPNLIWSEPGRPALAALGDLLTSGLKTLVVTADARRRSRLAGYVAQLTGERPTVLCARCSHPAEPSRLPLITDWGTLAAQLPVADPVEIVAAIDPPPGEAAAASALAQIGPGAPLFALWGPAEAEFALSCFRADWSTRGHAAAIYRGLRAGGPWGAEDLAAILAGDLEVARTPAAAARAIHVLAEVGLVEHSRAVDCGGEIEVCVVSSERTDLDRSEAYRRFCADHRAGESFLSRQQRQAA